VLIDFILLARVLRQEDMRPMCDFLQFHVSSLRFLFFSALNTVVRAL